MTDLRERLAAILEPLREMEGKATPGPWALRCCPRHEGEGRRVLGCLFIRDDRGARISTEPDLALAAALRSALPELLALLTETTEGES